MAVPTAYPMSREMQDLQNRLSQLTQTFFGDMWPLASGGRASSIVAVDIEETDDAYIVDLDLPNVSAEDVQIELRGDELRVFGQYQQRERGGLMRRQTRDAGEFEFLIDLPAEVEAEGVSAKLENGVLTIRAPKAKQSQARRIEVQEGHSTDQRAQGRERQSAQQMTDNQQQQQQQRQQAPQAQQSQAQQRQQAQQAQHQAQHAR